MLIPCELLNVYSYALLHAHAIRDGCQYRQEVLTLFMQVFDIQGKRQMLENSRFPIDPLKPCFVLPQGREGV